MCLVDTDILLHDNQDTYTLPCTVCSLLQDYEEILLKEMPEGLPPLIRINYQINIVSGSQFQINKPIYTIQNRLMNYKIKLKEKGLVKVTLSPSVVPTILVPKKNGTWRMCIDCRDINNIMVKYRHLISRIDDMLDKLCYHDSRLPLSRNTVLRATSDSKVTHGQA